MKFLYALLLALADLESVNVNPVLPGFTAVVLGRFLVEVSTTSGEAGIVEFFEVVGAHFGGCEPERAI